VHRAGSALRRPDNEEIEMKLFRSLLFALLLGFAASSAFAAEAVNINTADAALIAAKVSGIGPAKAEAIVAYRKDHGPFKCVDELAQVKGIGLKTVEKIRDQLTLGSGAAAAAPAPSGR
jgi:competence protein ComEA